MGTQDGVLILHVTRIESKDIAIRVRSRENDIQAEHCKSQVEGRRDSAEGCSRTRQEYVP
jgi:hypothetical protein